MPAIVGRTIVKTRVLDPRLTEPETPTSFSRKLKDRVIAGISRRGKYLRVELDDGALLVLHLRMTGIVSHVRPPLSEDGGKYLRLVFELDDGSLVTFQDSRRFGRAWLPSRAEADELWERMGPEPLERSFNSRTLASLLDGRKRPVKPAIMDQGIVAGIGNIYADEALFEAKIHPERPSGALSSVEIETLTGCIKNTLRRAVRLQGSSIDSYRDARGNRGRFQDTFKVHRRAGEPCPRCSTTVEKIKVGGRGTYFCPNCQREKGR